MHWVMCFYLLLPAVPDTFIYKKRAVLLIFYYSLLHCVDFYLPV